MASKTISGSSIIEFVDSHAPAMPSLPLTHVMDSYILERQYSESSISPLEKCDVYKEELVYLFYGRPSYRPDMSNMSSSLEYIEPVCFVLSPDVFQNVERLYPFDTGAHKEKLYDTILHPKMERADFELNPAKLEVAQKTISAFFGENKAYLLATPKNISQTGMDKTCLAYVNLIQNASREEVDDRSSAIELQFKRDVALDGNILAVIASVSEAEKLRKNIENICWIDGNVEVLEYFSIGRSNPREAFGAMRQVTMKWLSDKGYF